MHTAWQRERETLHLFQPPQRPVQVQAEHLPCCDNNSALMDQCTLAHQPQSTSSGKLHWTRLSQTLGACLGCTADEVVVADTTSMSEIPLLPACIDSR